MNPIDHEDRELSLMEALERYSDPVAWQEYQEFAPFYSPRIILIVGGVPTYCQVQEEHARTLRTRLENRLVEKLIQGD